MLFLGFIEHTERAALPWQPLQGGLWSWREADNLISQEKFSGLRATDRSPFHIRGLQETAALFI